MVRTPKKETFLKAKIKSGNKTYTLGKLIQDEELDFIKEVVGNLTNFIPIITKSGIKRIVEKLKLKVTFLNIKPDGVQIETDIPVIQKLGDRVYYIWCKVKSASAQSKNFSIEVGSIKGRKQGEIAGQYPVETLLKRARGRAVLDYIGMYEMYTEDEIQVKKITRKNKGASKKKIDDRL